VSFQVIYLFISCDGKSEKQSYKLLNSGQE